MPNHDPDEHSPAKALLSHQARKPSSTADHQNASGTQNAAHTAPISEIVSLASSKPKYVGNYELLQTIGEGSFAKVKLAIHRLTHQKVAIKIIDKSKLPDEYSVKNIHREAQIMRMVDHPNIIQLFEVMETKKNLFLVLEYAGKGELLDYIVSKGRLKEDDAKKFVRQILSALDHAHSANIVHRDLKAENLLIDNYMTIKISDFGLSNIYDNSGLLSTSCGSPVYSAPELVEGKKYVGPEVDAWSLGINVYAMVVGDLPFADANLTALYESILRGKYEMPDFVSAECRDFISKLLVVNPNKRATISQMRDHYWLSEGTSFLGPVSDEVGVNIRPRTEDQLDPEIMDQLEQMGFDREQAVQSIISSKFNQAAGTYYLIMYGRQQRQLHGDQVADTQEINLDFDNETRLGNLNDDEETAQNSEVTSDELARVLFKVAGIRRNTSSDLAAHVGGNLSSMRVSRDSGPGNGQRYPRREPNNMYEGSPSAEKRVGPRALSNMIESQAFKSSAADIEVKNGKAIVKRGRRRNTADDSVGGSTVEPSSNATTQFMLQQQQAARTIREQNDNNTDRMSQVSILPRIPQPKTNRASDSKVVNLPSIGSAYGSSPSSREMPSGATSGLKAALSPTMEHNSFANHRAGSVKPHNTRRLVKNKPIPIDDSLYLSKDQDNDGGGPITPGPMGIPRTIRFAFNCAATITLPPETIFERLRNAFDRNDVEWRNEGFLCECEWGDIKLEVEICKLPRVRSYGIRLKRNNGDIWEFKKLSGKLINELEMK